MKKVTLPQTPLPLPIRLTLMSCAATGCTSLPSRRATCEMKRPAPARVLSPTPRRTSAASLGASSPSVAASMYLQRQRGCGCTCSTLFATDGAALLLWTGTGPSWALRQALP